MLISSLCPMAPEEARAAGAGVVTLLVRGVEYPLVEELAVGAEVTESLLEILLAEEEGLPGLDWSSGGEAPAAGTDWGMNNDYSRRNEAIPQMAHRTRLTC